MDKKKRFKSPQEMLGFLRTMRKRNEASSRSASAKFEKEKKIWEERERAYDLDLEKKEHEVFLKDMRRIIREQKTLVEKVERMMRQTAKSGQPKTKRYKAVSSKAKSLVAESLLTYKTKKK